MATATAPEIVAPAAPEEKKEKELISVQGRALDVWRDAASTFIPTLKTGMTIEERRETIRKVAQGATGMDDRLNLVLGEVLFEAAENKYYQNWDNPETGAKFATFEEYCDQELNIQKSKAHYLKGIYKTFVVDLDLPVDQLRDLEWSKAKELKNVITKANAEDLIGKIKAMSVKQVKEMVASLQGKTPTATTTVTASEDDTKVPMNFKCSPGQAENIKAALAVAESMTGSNVGANNLDLICSDFVAGASGSGLAGVTSRLDVIIANVERSFGVKLEVKEIVDKARYEKLKTEAAKAEATPAAA